MQHEITTVDSLLDAHGNLRQAGYAKELLLAYRRADIKANPMRIKEWDYYLICNDHFALALTIADNAYMGLDSISFLNFDETWQKTVSPMNALTNGRVGLPETSVTGDVSTEGKRHEISFSHTQQGRHLTCRCSNFYKGAELQADILLTDEPAQSMVIATPFEKKRHFYYNQKIPCMRAHGQVRLGSRSYDFDAYDSFGILDWGRGVWPYANTWYWGAASGLCDGVSFGFNIGYGFGDHTSATENMVFWNGRAHKLDQVYFQIPNDAAKQRPNFLHPWQFDSNDGRFSMDFVPILDRAACTNALVIKSDQHQVFGRYTGCFELDDGTKIEIKDQIGFAEKVINRW